MLVIDALPLVICAMCTAFGATNSLGALETRGLHRPMPVPPVVMSSINQKPPCAHVSVWQSRRDSTDQSPCLQFYRCMQGIVAFFPSFAYADQVHAHWAASGALAAMAASKAVFREPRASTEVEAVLRCAGGRAWKQRAARLPCMSGVFQTTVLKLSPSAVQSLYDNRMKQQLTCRACRRQARAVE